MSLQSAPTRTARTRVPVPRQNDHCDYVRTHLLQSAENQSQHRICRSERVNQTGKRGALARQLYGLGSRVLRPRDLQIGTNRQSIRTKSVTYASGINRNPCGRNGPSSLAPHLNGCFAIAACPQPFGPTTAFRLPVPIPCSIFPSFR